VNAEAHLHQMARRHHATMKKLDGTRERFAGFTRRGISTIEMGAGAWVGGLMDGKLQWTVSPSLILGINLILLDYIGISPRDSAHYGNFGNGFLAGPLARAGYRFGQRMRERSVQPRGAP
jgi:hypothetical protein